MSLTIYVILAVIAAAVVAAVAKPHAPGPVRELLLASSLSPDDSMASVEIICGEIDAVPALKPGHVRLIRHGVNEITTQGAVSLAIKIKGQDIMIEERLTPGSGIPSPILSATFELGKMAPGFYHVHYNSVKANLWTAFTLHIRPGMIKLEPLKR